MPSRKPKYGHAKSDGSSKIARKEDADLANEEIKIHADRYKMLIEAVVDGIYEVDLNGNFRFFNDALSRIFGYSRNEIQGRNFREFMNEDNARVAFEAFNSIYRTGRGDVYIKWEISRKTEKIAILKSLPARLKMTTDNPLASEGLPGISPTEY